MIQVRRSELVASRQAPRVCVWKCSHVRAKRNGVPRAVPRSLLNSGAIADHTEARRRDRRSRSSVRRTVCRRPRPRGEEEEEEVDPPRPPPLPPLQRLSALRSSRTRSAAAGADTDMRRPVPRSGLRPPPPRRRSRRATASVRGRGEPPPLSPPPPPSAAQYAQSGGLRGPLASHASSPAKSNPTGLTAQRGGVESLRHRRARGPVATVRPTPLPRGTVSGRVPFRRHCRTRGHPSSRAEHQTRRATASSPFRLRPSRAELPGTACERACGRRVVECQNMADMEPLTGRKATHM